MHSISIFLPIIAYCLLTLSFARKTDLSEITDSFIKAHLVLFAFIAISTELLGSIQAISFYHLLTLWLLFLTVCSVIAAISRYNRRQEVNLSWLSPLPVFAKVVIGVISFILVTTFATALLYPPNNWDSMTYHMTRVLYWISNNELSFYSTANTRQNYLMPLAEYAIMHLQVLTGFDLYANVVQWICFFALICLGQLTAAELDLSAEQQLISALLIATMPMAILQASSTQNDLVVSSFVMSFGLYLLRIHKNISINNFLFASIALGLALLTKGTAYVYCAAIGVSLAIPVYLKFKADGPHLFKVIGGFTFTIILALTLSGGHFYRNYKLYGHPLSTEGTHYQNTEMSVPIVLANLLRNGALHFGTPSIRINNYIENALKMVLGSQLNNPNTTWSGSPFKIHCSRHEDIAGNFIHTLIALASMVILPTLWWQGHHKRTMWYAIGTMLGTILFCWILKWQPWASRLHTPLFAMASPLLAVAITTGTGIIWRRTGQLIVLCMVLSSMFFVFSNKSRSLVSLNWLNNNRNSLYFVNRPELLQSYEKVVGVIAQAETQEVGLYMNGDDWEYPILAYALQATEDKKTLRFKQVGVNNVSRVIDQDSTLPPYVITTRNLETWQYKAKYFPIYTSEYASVYKKNEN